MYKQTLEVLFKVRENPTLYLGRRSVELLATFIVGCDVVLCHADIGEKIADDRFYVFHPTFSTYVRKKFLIRDGNGWMEVLKGVAGSDDAAFDLFWEVFDEYVSPKKRKPQKRTSLALPVERTDTLDFETPVE